MGEKKGIGEVVQDICETNEYRLPRYEPGECATKRRSVTRAVTESVTGKWRMRIFPVFTKQG